MSRKKAVLMLDPDHRQEQLAFITERVEAIREFGEFLWVAITEEQASRFSQQGIQVQFQEMADQINLPAVIFDPAQGEPEPPAALAVTAPRGDETAYYLVQFFAPPDSGWISEIEEIGGIYIEDIPVHVAAFRLTAAQVPQVEELSFVSWVGLYHPAYALSYILAGRDEPYTATELRNLQVDPSQIVATETGTLEILCFDDVSSSAIVPAVEATGATIVTDTGYSLVVNIAAERVPNLLLVQGVQAIERYRPPQLANQRAGIIITANQVRNVGNVDFLVNLDGAGEIAGVIDTGLDRGAPPAPMHPDLAGRVLQVANLNGPAQPTADTFPHGTHVAGSIAGNGAQSGGTIRGIAPACQLIFHAVSQPTPGNPRNLNFNNFLTGLINAHNAGARIHSNSWGTTGATKNVYVDATSGVIDQFAFFNPESLVLFSSHNFEQDRNGDGVLDMNRLPNQGVAKNILCIGACENVTNTDGDARPYRNIPFFAGRYNHPALNNLAGPPPVAGNFPISDSADQVALFSNRGQVATPGVAPAQRRIKPDLVAPGTNIISTGPLRMLPFGGPAGPNTVSANDYYVSTGTSMATPIAAGAAVLTRQYYRARFGQLRRPLLLEQVAQLVDRPAIAPYRDGAVIAWIHRDTAAGQNHIVAARYSRSLERLGDIVQLQRNVGDRPAPMLARQGDHTLLLHRASDNTLRLSLYNANLTPMTTFGTNGTVTLAPATRTDDSRLPGFCIQGNEVAIVWNQIGGDNLLFQRYRADTGARVDTAPKILGSMTATSAHPFILHNGDRYVVVWVQMDGANHKLQIRSIDNTGMPVGSQPTSLVTQAQEIRDPHLVWSPLRDRFLVVWSGANTHPGGDIYQLTVDSNLNPVGNPSPIITVPPPNAVRRPYVAMHPDIFTGYILVWEDNTQNNSYDVYLTFLDLDGNPDGRINGNRLGISDTPQDTSGFTSLIDSSGTLLVWQSHDEINSDLLGIYALQVTNQGAFQAQVDPNTPLLNSGRYVRHLLHQHNDTDLTGVAMAWTGGDYYLLRAVPDGLATQLHLVHTNSDGLPDPHFGFGGARQIDSGIAYEQVALYWADTQILAAYTFGLSVKVFLLDGNGVLVNTFGVNGTRDLNEFATASISPQLGHRGSGKDFRVLLAYGRHGNPDHTIRYVVLDPRGNLFQEPKNLASASGTAKKGWFHFVESDHPSHAIAAWHRRVGGSMRVFINRYQFNGKPQHTPAIRLTKLEGDSQNAAIAPRPVLFRLKVPAAGGALNRRRREYGIVWEYRPHPANPGDPTPPTQIRFSRLNRDGTVGTIKNVEVVNGAMNATDPQLVWHTDGYGLAWLEQPVAGGNQILWFTVLDENGVRVNLAAFGAAVPAPAPNYQVSDSRADVKQFHLIWNGRTFRISWTQEQGGQLQHLQSAIAVPRQAGTVGYDQPYHHPTSALIRATLINGATNIRNTALPNLGNNPNDGYGWGRINLRQALAPSPPVTFHVRDDSAVASGRTVQYDFTLPPNTRLLRVTLAWTDPPGNQLINNLNLRVTVPGTPLNPSRTYVGNRWQPAPNAQFSDPLPTPPPINPFESVHNVEQIVIPDPPAGSYRVEVIGGRFSSSEFQQFPGQPFALVFIGSGPELRFGAIPAPAIPVY